MGLEDVCDCRYKEVQLYMRVQQYLLPLLRPMTVEGEIELELQNKTGWRYVAVNNTYCPMCGKVAKHRGDDVDRENKPDAHQGELVEAASV